MDVISYSWASCFKLSRMGAGSSGHAGSAPVSRSCSQSETCGRLTSFRHGRAELHVQCLCLRLEVLERGDRLRVLVILEGVHGALHLDDPLVQIVGGATLEQGCMAMGQRAITLNFPIFYVHSEKREAGIIHGGKIYWNEFDWSSMMICKSSWYRIGIRHDVANKYRPTRYDVLELERWHSAHGW